MSVGSFVGLKPVYTLTFTPSSDPTAPPEYDEYEDEIPAAVTAEPQPFSIGAHLKELTAREKTRLGYDPTEIVLEVLCADPKESDARIRHNSVATITPDFMGLTGTLRIQGRPLSRLKPVVDAIGVKLAGVFSG